MENIVNGIRLHTRIQEGKLKRHSRCSIQNQHISSKKFFKYNLEKIAKFQRLEKLEEANGARPNKRYKVWMYKKERLMILTGLASQTLNELHEYLGHPGTKNTYYSIKDFLYVKKIKKTIETTIGECEKCI